MNISFDWNKNRPETDLTYHESLQSPNIEKSKSENLQTTQKNLEHSLSKLSPEDYLVAFTSGSSNYCVGFIDIVNSTKISSSMNIEKTCRYFEIFLNTMSKIVSRHGGEVIKNLGDSLLFYFPESAKSNTKYGLISCIECCLSMVEARRSLCPKLDFERLPPLDYRVSADFGTVKVMTANNTEAVDLIGPPVNMCYKINRFAPSNGIVLGSDLHQQIKNLPDYKFRLSGKYSLGFKFEYPVYSVSRKQVS